MVILRTQGDTICSRRIRLYRAWIGNVQPAKPVDLSIWPVELRFQWWGSFSGVQPWGFCPQCTMLQFHGREFAVLHQVNGGEVIARRCSGTNCVLVLTCQRPELGHSSSLLGNWMLELMFLQTCSKKARKDRWNFHKWPYLLQIHPSFSGCSATGLICQCHAFSSCNWSQHCVKWDLKKSSPGV